MSKNFAKIIAAIIVILAVICTSGCFQVGGMNCYLDSQGQWRCEVAVGNGGGYPGGTMDDSVLVSWESSYDGYYISDFQLTCIFDDGVNEEFSQVAEVYVTDGYYVDAVFYNIPSHFDAECVGTVSFNDGPPTPLFSDEVPTGNVLFVQWEDEEVDHFYARNNELDVDND
jgi:hypothetical protein